MSHNYSSNPSHSASAPSNASVMSSLSNTFRRLQDDGVAPLLQVLNDTPAPSRMTVVAAARRERLERAIQVIGHDLYRLHEQCVEREKMYKVLQRQRDNDRQVAESLQAEQAAWQRETVQAQQTAESLQAQVATLQDEKTKLQNQLLDVRRKQTAIFGSFLAVAEPPKPHKQPSSAAAACNHTPLVEALPLDSHTFRTSEEENCPAVEGTHLSKIAKLEQDLADERTKTEQALAKAENWRLQAMSSPIARRRHNTKNPPNNERQQDTVAHVLQLQSERDAERHENFFLRRQLMQLQNKTATTAATAPSQPIPHRGADRSVPRRMNHDKLPAKKRILMQHRLEHLQREHDTLKTQAKKATQTLQNEKTRLSQELSAANNENQRLSHSMRKVVSTLEKALKHGEKQERMHD